MTRTPIRAGTATGTHAVPPAAAPPAREPGRVFLAAAYLVLLALGIVLAVFGTFYLSAGPRSGTTLTLPLGLLVALIGHPVAGLLGLHLTGTRAGTLTPLLGWSLVVLPLSSGTTEGDIVLPGTLLSIIYLLVGVATYGIVAVLTRPRRGRSALPTS